MAHTISITNQKGGCGKTTTVINLSSLLANKGYRVLAVDIDHQADLTKVLGNQDMIYENHCGTLIANNKININKCIYSAENNGEEIKNLELIPSHISLSRIVEQNAIKTHKEKILYRHFLSIQENYDYIIFDCPPNLSLGFINAVYLSDHFLIPIDGGKFSLDGLSDLMEAISEVKEKNISELNYYVFRNEYALNNKLINQFIDEELKNISTHVLKSRIRRTESIGQASVTSLPLYYYSPKSVALKDYENLSNELVEKTSKKQSQ